MENEENYIGKDMYEAFGGDEIASMHPMGWVYVSEGVYVDSEGYTHEW